MSQHSEEDGSFSEDHPQTTRGYIEDHSSEPNNSVNRGINSGVVPISELQYADLDDFDDVVESQNLGVVPKPVLRNSPSAISYYLHLLNEVHMPSEIDEGIYISNFETAEAYLQGHPLPHYYPPIRYVLSVIDFTEDDTSRTWAGIDPRYPERFPDGNLLRVNMKDSTKVQYIDWFPRICAFIDRAVLSGGSILVHCRKGISRSVTAVMVYLMWRRHLSVRAAFEFVQKKRPVAWPNKEFFHQLKVWGACDCELLGVDEDGTPAWREEYTEIFSRGLYPADPTQPAEAAETETAMLNWIRPEPDREWEEANLGSPMIWSSRPF